MSLAEYCQLVLWRNNVAPGEDDKESTGNELAQHANAVEKYLKVRVMA